MKKEDFILNRLTRCKAWKVFVIFLALTFFDNLTARAQSTDEIINNGVNWLISAKGGVSYWGLKDPNNAFEITKDDLVPTYLRDTLEAVATLQDIDSIMADIPDAIEWIGLQKLSLGEQMAREIILLSNVNLDVNSKIETLRKNKNS